MSITVFQSPIFKRLFFQTTRYSNNSEQTKNSQPWFPKAQDYVFKLLVLFQNPEIFSLWSEKTKDVITLEKHQPAKVWKFCLRTGKNNWSFIKIFAGYISAKRMTDYSINHFNTRYNNPTVIWAAVLFSCIHNFSHSKASVIAFCRTDTKADTLEWLSKRIIMKHLIQR